MSEDSLAPPLDGLIGSLYQCLLEPGTWPDVVRGITQFSGGTMGALQVRQLSPELTTALVSSGVEPAFQQAYVDHHYLHDSHLQRAASLTQGQTLLSRDVLSDEEFRRSFYYNEYCRPHGIRDLMGVMLVCDSERVVSFATYAPRSGSFGERDRRRLQQLVPHLARVVKLTLEQEQRRSVTCALQAAQHGTSAAVMVVDRGLRVHASSGALDHWLGQPGGCLEVRQGTLVARGATQARLVDAVARALDGCAAEVQLVPELGKATLVAASTSCFVPRPLVNLVLTHTADAGKCSPALRELPPALRPVARMMAQGAAYKEVAVALGITLSSARTYAARVLKRTGTQSRRELMLRARSS